jgi:hypothetical protein
LTWATDRLDQIKGGDVVLPPVVQTLQLGGLDDWGEGWVRKTWTPASELLNVDGSLSAATSPPSPTRSWPSPP